RGAAPPAGRDLARQREVVDAFFAAARAGEFEALVAVLDPDVVLRSDGGRLRGASVVLRGAEAVAGQALRFAGPGRVARPVVVTVKGNVVSLMAFTVAGGRVVEIDALVDPDRLRRLDLGGPDEVR